MSKRPKKERIVARVHPDVAKSMHRIADRFGFFGTATAASAILTALHEQPHLLEALMGGRLRADPRSKTLQSAPVRTPAALRTAEEAEQIRERIAELVDGRFAGHVTNWERKFCADLTRYLDSELPISPLQLAKLAQTKLECESRERKAEARRKREEGDPKAISAEIEAARKRTEAELREQREREERDQALEAWLANLSPSEAADLEAAAREIAAQRKFGTLAERVDLARAELAADRMQVSVGG